MAIQILYRTNMELAAVRLNERPGTIEGWVKSHLAFLSENATPAITSLDLTEQQLEATGPELENLRQLYASFYATGNWKLTLNNLGNVLPPVVERLAIESSRSAFDIADDLLQVILEPLTLDLRAPSGLRKEQTKASFIEGWIIAYPPLDLVEGDTARLLRNRIGESELRR